MKLSIKNKIIFHIVPFVIGIIISFGLPPYNHLLINFIFFPFFFIFFVSNFNNNKWKSFKIGWLFGFGYFISNLYWITNSLTFDEQFKFLIPIAFLLIPLFLGLFYGLATFFCFFFKLENNFSSILIFATILSVTEFLRGSILGGFPWNLHAFSFVGYISFLQSLSFFGTYAFNLLSITIFIFPAIFFSKKNVKLKLLSSALLLTLLLLNYVYGLSTINNYNQNQNIRINDTIKIVSPKIEINRFFQTEVSSSILDEIIKLSDPKKQENTIFIFPEGILTSVYLEELKNYINLFENKYSPNHKIILGINSFQNSKIYNSMVVLDNKLNTLYQYKKNKLVPFGEFLPLENLLSNFGIKKITSGYQSFSSDDKRKIFSINDTKFLPLICYEIIYTGKINKNKKDYDFIINISEDGWFGHSIGLDQHFSHSIFRAIEEGKNLIRSANNGVTAYVDAKGQVIKRIESTQRGVIEINTLKKVDKTFFSNHGNIIFFYFLVFYIILIFFLKKIGRLTK